MDERECAIGFLTAIKTGGETAWNWVIQRCNVVGMLTANGAQSTVSKYEQGALPVSTIATAPIGSVVFDADVAHNLEGKMLGKWTLVRKARLPVPSADQTGGHFSVGYEATADDAGKLLRAFIKVFDFAMAFANCGGDVMRTMYQVSSEHQHETRLLTICADAKLDRIIKVLGSGQDMVQTASGHSTPVVYIAFEPADGDMRKIIKKIDAVDLAWRLSMLHQVAVGLQQLHMQGISHQDLKPSNVMICDSRNEGTKIGDLGRATHDRIAAGHDDYPVVGDRRYAPPEQAYGIVAVSPQDRRQGCDLYHLGCLIAFAFSSTTPNQGYLKLPIEIRPPCWNNGEWRGTYDEVKHHLDAAFTEYLVAFRASLPEWLADEITGMVQYLCTPHYLDRGHPDARRQAGRPLGLDRFISRLQHLAGHANVRAKLP